MTTNLVQLKTHYWSLYCPFSFRTTTRPFTCTFYKSTGTGNS